MRTDQYKLSSPNKKKDWKEMSKALEISRTILYGITLSHGTLERFRETLERFRTLEKQSTATKNICRNNA